MEARTNDRYRNYIVEDLGTKITSENVFVILTYQEGRTSIPLISPRATYKSILDPSADTTVVHTHKVLTTEVFRALAKGVGVVKPQDTTETRIYNADYYVSDNSGLGGGLEDMFNAVYLEIELPANNPGSPTYFNTVTLVIADNTTGTINADTIIVTQTHLPETTLPYDNEQVLQILVRY